MTEKTKEQWISPLLPGLYPPPGTSPNRCLLQGGIGRALRAAARSRRAHSREADDRVFVRAEAAHTRLVHSRRQTIERIAGQDAAGGVARCVREVVTALGTGGSGCIGDKPVNQASVRRSRGGATGRSARAQSRNGGRIEIGRAAG